MKQVTIELPKQKDGEYAISQGARVLSNGKEINGIKSVTVKMAVDEMVIADMELFVTFEKMEGVKGRFVMIHPLKGMMSEVDSIRFSDGELLVL